MVNFINLFMANLEWVSYGLNAILGIGLFFIFTDKTFLPIIVSKYTGKTLLMYWRSNGMITLHPCPYKDGMLEPKREGLFIVTGKSTPSMQGNLRTAIAYEGYGATLPPEFIKACQEAEAAGVKDINHMDDLINFVQSENPEKDDPEKTGLIPKVKKVLRSFNVEVIRDFFRYDITPTGMTASINRRVTIELQNEKDLGWAAFLFRPEVLVSLAVVILVIFTIGVPMATNQQGVQECQSRLTGVIAARASGVSVS